MAVVVRSGCMSGSLKDLNLLGVCIKIQLSVGLVWVRSWAETLG